MPWASRRQYERPLQWLAPPTQRTERAEVRYTGQLARRGTQLVLHLGYDGWTSPRDVRMARVDASSWVAEVPTEHHLVVDCVVRDHGASGCDNNEQADYRLWIGLDPVDAHVHARGPGRDSLGFDSLRTALDSGGMTHAVVSWKDNEYIDLVTAAVPWLTRLVWAAPNGPSVESVRDRLAGGAVGLKLHPAYDAYPADSQALDPYLAVADEAGVPVTVHSGPGPADPDLIRRLAERFPSVRFVLYHTYLGPPEGRRRASRHAQELPNLYLETSWCSSGEVERLLDDVGPDRVIFGSDAATDGPQHFVRRPPNIELVENYNETLLRLAQRLPADTTRKLLEDNARALFATPPRTAGTPPRTPDRSAQDLRNVLSSALVQVRRLIGPVRREQLALPTPCAQWDVRHLMGHLLAVVRRAGTIGEDRAAPAGPRIVLVEPGDWREAFAAGAAQADSAWARPQALTGSAPTSWGRVPSPVALSGVVLELVAHAWDLAVSIEVRPRLDPALAAAAMQIATRLVPVELRDDGGAFAPPVAAPVGADPATKLAAYLGRRTPF